METVRHCVDYNYNVILEMVKDTAYLFENQNAFNIGLNNGWVTINIYIYIPQLIF